MQTITMLFVIFFTGRELFQKENFIWDCMTPNQKRHKIITQKITEPDNKFPTKRTWCSVYMTRWNETKRNQNEKRGWHDVKGLKLRRQWLRGGGRWCGRGKARQWEAHGGVNVATCRVLSSSPPLLSSPLCFVHH
jgi:hypothetical protein